jgi:hypothetical protein
MTHLLTCLLTRLMTHLIADQSLEDDLCAFLKQRKNVNSRICK